MPALTTVPDVKRTIETLLKDSHIERYIEDASLWVTEELGSAPITDARMELIARYLTCALIRLRDLGITRTTIEGVSEQYQVDPEVTDYLKRASGLDPTGRVREELLSEADQPRMLFRVGQKFTRQQT